MEPVRHKQTAALMDALKADGWTMTHERFPETRSSPPAFSKDLPTPDYMRGRGRGRLRPIFKLRQVTFNHRTQDRRGVDADLRCPVGDDSSPKVSFKRAIEFINEEWEP
jgi:hypothetical protein